MIRFGRFRHGVLETRRFQRHVADRDGASEPSVLGAWLLPIVHLAREHPARALLIAVLSFAMYFGQVSVFQLIGKFVIDERGWAPWQFAVMFVVGGALGSIGNVIAGRLGDRLGRRTVGAASMLAFPIFSSLCYLGPGWALPPAWIGFVFCVSANTTVLRAFATELFPTSQRGTAMGLSEVVGAVGSTVGLAVLGLGTQTAAADAPLQAAFDRLPFDLERERPRAMTSLLLFAVAVAGILLRSSPRPNSASSRRSVQKGEPRGASAPGSLPLLAARARKPRLSRLLITAPPSTVGRARAIRSGRGSGRRTGSSRARCRSSGAWRSRMPL